MARHRERFAGMSGSVVRSPTRLRRQSGWAFVQLSPLFRWRIIARVLLEMENIHELQRQATDAISSRLWTNTVAVVNSIRTIGLHPVTNRPADGEEAGTGCAARWGRHHFILTAGHVPHPDAKPSDLRIFWRPTGSAERIAQADLKPQDIGDAVAIRDPKAAIHQCRWEDLAIIELDP